MTELKCPVCQNNLHKINIVVSTCTNDKCKLWGSSIPNLVLEALADTKNKLDIAVGAIKKADHHIRICHYVQARTDLSQALEQINQKENQ